MHFFNHFRIGTRLGASFAGLLLLIMAVAAVGAWQLRQVAFLTTESSALDEQVKNIERWHGAVTLNLTRALAVGASGYHGPTVAFLEPPMKETSATITQLQDAVDKVLSDPDDRALFDDVGSKRKNYVEVRAKAAAAFKAGQSEEGLALVNGPMTAGAKAYLDAISTLQKRLEGQADVLQAQVKSRSEQAQWLMLALAALAAAMGATMAWSITRSVTTPLKRAVLAAERIADKDLSEPLHVDGRSDEFGELQSALAAMQGSLLEVLSQIRVGTEGVAGASHEIAAANMDLSQRTEETAGSLQQTASTMEQITATVNQTADSARTANQLATSACEVARRGGDVVGQVVSTMDSINASSRQISDIIGTIDGIAFQTNILALNAAVEAARAGEQGRGFAVVASEVRSLAQRSADAAKQIKGLIGTSVERVDAGMRLVGDAGQTMNEIVDSVQRVSDIIAEVMAAAGEQSQGVAQVTGSVSTLDQMTQQNAALVEETAAAAQSLKDQAQQLTTLATSFRVDPTSAPADRSPAPALAVRHSSASPAWSAHHPLSAPASAVRSSAPAVTAKPPAAPSTAPAKQEALESAWASF